ncbi:hypothetical protein T03_17038, partial [Trichinella britovi]
VGLRSRKVSTFPWREKKPVFPFLSNRKTVPREQYTTAALRATVRKACLICGEDHAIENCPKRGHPLASCKSKVKCRTEECSKRHHPLIPPNQDKPSVSENQPNTSAIKTANPHAVYHYEQLEELGRLAPEDLTPVMEIYDEFASNASTSLDTAAYLPTWDQVPHTIYNRRARRYPRPDGWMGKSAGAASYC